ncbi:MAG: AmmeMemoRadiSam system protein A [Nitrospirota bacterium]
MTQTIHPLVQLAREAINEYLKSGEVLKTPDGLSDEMKESHGVFVSLKMHGMLRGCIGTFEPSTSCVAEEVIHNAISSATRDPRFMPVTQSELANIVISVDILTTPIQVNSERDLDSKRYGVIVKSGHRRGLLLPDLEGVDTIEEQIKIAKRKAGIGSDEPVDLFRFEVKRYK